jgi:hypothetical protein
MFMREKKIVSNKEKKKKKLLNRRNMTTAVGRCHVTQTNGILCSVSSFSLSRFLFSHSLKIQCAFIYT